MVFFPSDYVVVDIETTGRSPYCNEIIELSAIRVRDNKIQESYSTLVKPRNSIDEFISRLTHITDEMVADAPSIEECIGLFTDFIGNDIVLGYNISFDINFIYDNLKRIKGIPLTNSFVDVLRIAKRALPELQHHRQGDIAKYFNITNTNAHRALSDCEVCYACYYALQKHIIENGCSLAKFTAHKHIIIGSKYETPRTDREPDPENPLYGKICVFTGSLELYKREKAEQIVTNIGGIVAPRITKATNFLILGNNDYCKAIKDGKSTKQKQAEKYLLAGQDIQIISEQVFYDMITEN